MELQNIKDLETKEFYQNVSIVSQDFVKYEMTLQENIGISDWKQMGNTDKIPGAFKTNGFTGVIRSGCS